MKYLYLLFLVACASSQTPPVSKPEVAASPIPSKPAEYLTCVEGAANLENSKLQHYQVSELEVPNNHFDLPVVYNKEVQIWINYFTGRGRVWTEKYLNNSLHLSHQFSEILASKGLPRDLIFLSMAESGFQYDIASHARAVGAWQFMSPTGKRYGLKVDPFYDERRNPEKAAYAAVAYLDDLYKMFGSWELAMAAYNAGENKIARAIKRYGTKDFWKLIKRGRYLKPETKNYVPKIMALAIIGKNLSHYGFANIEKNITSTKTFEVLIPARTDLVKLSEMLNLEFDFFRRLNPEYVRWHTPLAAQEYVLRIPESKREVFEKIAFNDLVANEFQLSPYKELKKASRTHRIPLEVLEVLNAGKDKNAPVMLPYRQNHTEEERMYADFKFKKRNRYVSSAGTYKVKSGESLWSISRKLGISLSKIKKLNSSRKNIRAGDYLVVN